MGICHVCNSKSVIEISSNNLKKRVSGDCKPIDGSTDLLICKKCHCVQKKITPEWLETVDRIFGSYTIYYQTGGSEQLLFIDGVSLPRSHRIISALLEQHPLPDYGSLLDIGCGNGSFLSTFHQNKPGWTLNGSELNDHNRSIMESIPRFDTLWCCSSPKEIFGNYDIISMIHVFESIVSPVSFLTDVKELLSDDGLLLIEVPNYLLNPFDFIIVDQTTHFSLETLCAVVEQAGFEILWKSDSEIPRELTLLAKKNLSHVEKRREISIDGEREVRNRLEWLDNLRSQALSLVNNLPFGIFGTAISATWLFSEIPDHVHFFVDENPSAIGKTHFRRPIYDPAHIPCNSTIFLPFCSQQAQEIKARLENKEKSLTFICPQPYK